MPVEIPNLVGTSIESLAVCAIFPAESEAVGRYVKANAQGIKVSKVDADGEMAFVRATIGFLSLDRPHCHFEIAKPSHLGSYRLPDKKLVPTLEIAELLDGFLGYPGDVYITAEYQMPFSELPEDGLVRKLIGMSATVSGSEVVFTGGEVSIAEEPFSILKWRMESEDSMSGKIVVARSEWSLTSQYLVESKQLAETGIAKYVREDEASSGL